MLLASEGCTAVAFYLSDERLAADMQRIGPQDGAEAVGVVRFRACAHMFGPPNDEAFGGHPLAGRGLRPYGAFEVVGSSWIRQLERMNSVHERHRPERFAKLRHFVLSFHDSTFECVAEHFEIAVCYGELQKVIQEAFGSIQYRAG